MAQIAKLLLTPISKLLFSRIKVTDQQDNDKRSHLQPIQNTHLAETTAQGGRR